MLGLHPWKVLIHTWSAFRGFLCVLSCGHVLVSLGCFLAAKLHGMPGGHFRSQHRQRGRILLLAVLGRHLLDCFGSDIRCHVHGLSDRQIFIEHDGQLRGNLSGLLGRQVFDGASGAVAYNLSRLYGWLLLHYSRRKHHGRVHAMPGWHVRNYDW